MGVEEFKQRRANFAKAMPANSIAVIPAAKEVTRSNDTEYAFCQQKNFLYLTNFNEPDALLVIIKHTEIPTEKKATKDSDFQSILFSLPKDPLHEVWHGRRVGQIKAKSDYGFNKCYTLDEACSIIPELLSGKDHVLFPFNNDKSCESEAGESFSEKIFSYLAQVRKTIRQGGVVPTSLLDSNSILNELRLHKTEAEILHMKQVNLISGLAHQRAMKETSPGKFEYQIEAELLHEFNRHGARHAAYASIVAGGDNGNILHYTANDMRLNDGDLLLIDAGGELDGYAADITRTFPVNGKFNDEQSAIYALVLNAQNAVIEAIKPNVTFAHLTILCNNILTKGLRELGILKGDLATLLEENAVKKYFIHGLGHWLGLDVHDVGDYQIENKQQNRPFKPGMVLTIEPGLYIPSIPDANDIEDKWRGIAIRIEDNILVTPTGHENLTVNTPKTIDEIELLMAETQQR
ncbi:MAG: aminopeptidase P N-terminal domain-containing protein [Colwellia sp.]